MPLKQVPRIVTVTLTNANQEYDYVLPTAIVAFDVQVRQDRDILVAFEEHGTDIPAGGQPWTLKAGTVYYKDVKVPHFAFTAYLRDPVNAGTIVEVVLWEEKG